MQWTSALAIFVLFWVMCAFIVMPMGIRSADEIGAERVPGQSDGAPANFQPGKILLRTTLLSAILFGLYYANYVTGWITTDMLDMTRL